MAVSEDQPTTASNMNSIYSTRIIAYYNLAVEYEHVGNLSESVRMFRKALGHSCIYNGEDDALSRIILTNLEEVRDKKVHRQNLHLMRSLERNEKATKHFFNDTEHIRNITMSLANRRRVQLDHRRQLWMSSSRRLGQTTTVGASGGEVGHRSLGPPSAEVRSVRNSTRSIPASAGQARLKHVKSKE